MFGWSIIARAWRSASNRAITWRESIPGLMIFKATLRRSGLRLLGHVDDPHAPFADLLQQLVRADDRAGSFGQGRLGEARLVGGRREDGVFQDVAGVKVGPEQTLHFAAQGGIVAASVRKVAGSFGGRVELQAPRAKIPCRSRAGWSMV